jgi:hypothetical protein
LKDAYQHREFSARLKDRTNAEAADEFVTLSLDEVPESDRALVQPGAVFYWFIGYDVSRFGQLTRTSRIRFRRLPAWTPAERRKIEERAAHIARVFGIND